MAAVRTEASVWSQQNPLHIYGGLTCNLLMADSWSDRSPLHEAASQGRLLLLRSLIAQGFHVDTLTMDGVSSLHEACLGGHYNCAKLLLESGAKADVASADGATPLFNSCRSGSAACVGLLLQHGASVHSTHQLASPMHEAAVKDHRECLELLQACGAQIDTELPEVGSPLYCACGAGAAGCVEMLLLAGADVGVGCGRDSPLHAAVRRGDPSVVQLLLDFGANMFHRNSEGQTPLDLSAPNSSVRFALQRRRGPSSLSQLCRFCIRQSLGRSRLHRAPSLPMPHRIQDFLLYR
ncbi:ankyrin repeat and SOCS box protein 11 isoform X2 [Oryzias melastigma]|uniref:Ankyrin repeat and SOCS box protein 11 n=1 Tax=Oryzias melastigma TaxID=30732 RepID=A0A3B3CJU8_ORYME|nr:ankyrin repeat and SOCS box protein 11 isoform X2 [Oryzias melastigma]